MSPWRARGAGAPAGVTRCGPRAAPCSTRGDARGSVGSSRHGVTLVQVGGGPRPPHRLLRYASPVRRGTRAHRARPPRLEHDSSQPRTVSVSGAGPTWARSVVARVGDPPLHWRARNLVGPAAGKPEKGISSMGFKKTLVALGAALLLAIPLAGQQRADAAQPAGSAAPKASAAPKKAAAPASATPSASPAAPPAAAPPGAPALWLPAPPRRPAPLRRPPPRPRWTARHTRFASAISSSASTS